MSAPSCTNLQLPHNHLITVACSPDERIEELLHEMDSGTWREMGAPTLQIAALNTTNPHLIITWYPEINSVSDVTQVLHCLTTTRSSQ